MFELDNTKIEKYKNKLEKEDNLIPLCLMIYINPYKYIHNLQKEGVYDEVMGEMFKRREKIRTLSNNQTISFEEKELNSWLKEHKEYEDILL